MEDLSEVNIEEIQRVLGVDLNVGLGKREVEHRLKQYGYNEVPEKKANALILFLKKFLGLSAWMLEIIIVLSWILRKTSDFYIVTALLVFNSVLGYIEEHKASSAVDSLMQRLQVNARVLRDRVWTMVPARELVPGDLVRLRSGDFVPADVRIVTGEVGVDQSALTGESQLNKRSQQTTLSIPVRL